MHNVIYMLTFLLKRKLYHDISGLLLLGLFSLWFKTDVTKSFLKTCLHYKMSQ